MANDQSKRLAVDLVAKVDKLEKEMKKARNVANDNFSAIEKRGRQFAGRLEKDIGGAVSRVGGLFKEFGAGLIGGVGGLSGLVATTREIAKGIAEIGDSAKRAGLSNKAFQELSYVAKVNRVEVDSLVDGIKELNIRASEFAATGKGGAAGALQQLGYDSTTLAMKLKDPSELFTEIIGKLAQLDRASAIRLADEIFGGNGGEKFVQLLDQGEKGIRDQIKAAHDLGAVLADDVIAKADEVDRKFQAIATTIGFGVRGAIVEAVSALDDFLDRAKQITEQNDTNISAQLAAIGKQRLDIENELRRLNNGEGVGDGILGTSIGETSPAERIAELTRENEALAVQEQRLLAVSEARRKASAAAAASVQRPPISISTSASDTKNSFSSLDEIVSKYVEDVIKAESGGNANAKNSASSATGLGQFIKSTWLDLFKKNFPDRAKEMSDATILALRSDAEISRKLIEAYARENADILRQAGVSVNEAALHLAHFLGPQGAVSVLTAKAGTPVSQVLGSDAIAANPSILGNGATVDDVISYANKRAGAAAQIEADYKAAKEAVKEFDAAQKLASQSAEQLGSAVGGALKGLMDAFADGKLEASELLGIVTQLAGALLRMPGGIIGQGGFLGGLLGSVLHTGGVAGSSGTKRSVSPAAFVGAPRYHSGGVAGLKPGEIPAILQRGELIIPRGGKMPAVGGGGGQSVIINAPINAPGADAAQLARVERSVQELGKNIPKMVVATNRQVKVRNQRP